uniref:C2H2-type domain-containing protein n=1 Tax=Phlebotomus papatasi TaxID=29031 RepID=A0A1B0DB67_PHLPP
MHEDVTQRELNHYFRCKICNAATEGRNAHYEHLKGHPEMKIFKCRFCRKELNSLEAYAEHENIHFVERPYICEICSKSFKQNTHLTRHMNIHTLAKKYPCNFCVRQSDGSEGGEGANPSPFCLPIPIPFFNIELCVKLFDLSTPGPNLHMCMDWLARIASVPIIVLHFDCMQIGLDGVSFMKPGESIDGPPNVSPIGPTGGIIEPGSPLAPGSPVAPVAPVAPAPVQPPTDTGIITSPSGPNLPQVGGDGSDFDPVDDIKKKPVYF